MTATIHPIGSQAGALLDDLRASDEIGRYLRRLRLKSLGDGAKCRLIEALLATIGDGIHRAASDGRFDHDTTYDVVDDVIADLNELRERLRIAATLAADGYARPAPSLPVGGFAP